MDALDERWRQASQGKRTVTHAMFMKDRGHPGHYMAMVEFPNYEEAMRNNEMPETQEFAREMAALCDGPIKYLNTEVIREDRG